MKNKDLKEFRETNGLSQHEFARKLGVSQPAISTAEKKPEHFVSNNMRVLLQKNFQEDDKNLEDQEINVQFSLKFKKSEMENMHGKKAIIDLSPFFKTL